LRLLSAPCGLCLCSFVVVACMKGLGASPPRVRVDCEALLHSRAAPRERKPPLIQTHHTRTEPTRPAVRISTTHKRRVISPRT